MVRTIGGGTRAPSPFDPFTSVSMGYSDACGLETSGAIVCWGSVDDSPPAGRFSAVSAGLGEACGIRREPAGAGGPLACWGNAYIHAPSGRFVQLSGAACGLRANGVALCWRDDAQQGLVVEAQGGRFVQVSFSPTTGEACGVRVDHSIACWGGNQYIQSHMPRGKFLQVSSGGAVTPGPQSDYAFACALSVDQSLVCWGAAVSAVTAIPKGRFDQVTVGQNGNFACGLRPTGAMLCWGDTTPSSSEPWMPPAPHAMQGRFITVTAGFGSVCGIRSDGVTVCTGNDDEGQDDPPGLPFIRTNTNQGEVCAVRSDSSAACWPLGTGSSSPQPPAGAYTLVVPGAGLAFGPGPRETIEYPSGGCGLRKDRTIVCWFPRYLLKSLPWSSPPQGQFRTLTVVNTDTACALRMDGAMLCWGDHLHRKSKAGRFLDFGFGRGANGWFGCAVGYGGSLYCWGDPTGWRQHGSKLLPSGPFRDVSAGAGVCALRASGSVMCWGGDARWSPAPTARFIELGTPGYVGSNPDAGVAECGLRQDHHVLCWNSHGTRLRTIQGLYRQVDAVGSTVCGIDIQGALQCPGFQLPAAIQRQHSLGRLT